MKRNSIYKYLLFTFSIFAFFFVKVEAATTITKTREIHYGQTAHIISGTEFSGVQCSYSGDTDKFIVTHTNNSDNWYVEVNNSSVDNGTIHFQCTYMNRYAVSDGNRRYIDSDGTIDYTITVTESTDYLNKIEIYLDKQFIKSVDMAGYLSQKAAVGVESFRLSDNFSVLFDNLNVPGNGNSCLLTLKDNAAAETVNGQLFYGTNTIEFVVHVSEEWMVHASSGYGSCEFNPPSDPDRWSKRDNSNWYYAYFNIKNESIVLPSCTADSSTGNAYLALDFVGWTYAKDSKTDSNVDPYMYQTAGTCSLFFKDSYTPEEQAMYPNMSIAKQYVGTIHAGQALKPENMTFDGSANSAFYACYKRTGIAFNLNGATVEDNTAIMDWATYNGVYYRTQSELNSPTFVLPSKVEPSALKSDYKFIGWDNGLLGYNGTNPEVLLTGGTSVSTDSGYIYSPIFVREQTGQSFVTKTVYVDGKISFIAPDGFSCYSSTTANYSVTPSNGECIISGIKSTNGEYKDYVMNSGAKTFVVKIGVVSVIGDEGVEKDPIQIGDGELITDRDNGEGNSSVSEPADCDSYFVGSSDIVSDNLFKFKPAQGNSDNTISITTYYAISNCGDATEYAALCIDPGRSGPTQRNSVYYKNGHKGQDYTFTDYINFNTEDNDYVRSHEFNLAVANIISRVGNVNLATFNEKNNAQKIAANMAIRIITIHTNYSVTPDSAGAFEGENRFVTGFQVYQSMEQHLRGYLGTETITVEMIKNNAEWVDWGPQFDSNGGTSDTVIEYLADYLSYDQTATGEDWAVEPTIDVRPWHGDAAIDIERSTAYTATFTFPDLASPIWSEDNAYMLGVGIHMDARIKDYYDIRQIYGSSVNPITDPVCNSGGCDYEIKLSKPVDWDVPDVEFKLSFVVIPKVINGKLEFPMPNSRDLAFYVTYKSSFSTQNAFVVTPTNNEASVQRMLLFNSEKAKKWVGLNIMNCNTLLTNFGDDANYFEAIYNAGCCDTIEENGGYSDFYNAYCKKDCVANTFVPVCTFNETCILERNEATMEKDGESVSSEVVTCVPSKEASNNYYKIMEATTKKGVSEYKCIVDPRKPVDPPIEQQIMMVSTSGSYSNDHPFTATSQMKDVTGQNSIAVQSYNQNPYCRVTCKEDWAFNMPGFYNFIGKNAIKAGSLFQINNSIYLSSTTTCVTSYINYNAYLNSVARLTTLITNSYNEYSKLSAAHTDI